MRVMILSFNAGEGHNSAAKALKEDFILHGVHCDIEDTMSLISPRLSRFISNGFVFMYRYIPALFNYGYKYAEDHPSLFGQGTWVYKIFILAVKKMLDDIETGGYDTVICTHPFSAVMLTAALEARPLNIKTAFVDTDYTCHPSTDQSKVDRYYIPDDTLTEEFTKKGLPKDHLVPSGIPIRQMFVSIKDKQTAKAELDIHGKHHMVMMCGSMGCGPIKKLAHHISEGLSQDDMLSIVCGNNKKLKNSLEKRYSGNKNIRVLGFVTDISTLMDSCDLYITKPGGISTSEATSKRLPMAFIAAVAGCEMYNKDFFVKKGAAIAEKDTKKLAERCLCLLHDDETLKAMSAAFKDMPNRNAADIIVNDISKVS